MVNGYMRSAGRPARDAGAVEFARPPWATIAIARAVPAGASVQAEGRVPVSVIPAERTECWVVGVISGVRTHFRIGSWVTFRIPRRWGGGLPLPTVRSEGVPRTR